MDVRQITYPTQAYVSVQGGQKLIVCCLRVCIELGTTVLCYCMHYKP